MFISTLGIFASLPLIGEMPFYEKAAILSVILVVIAGIFSPVSLATRDPGYWTNKRNKGRVWKKNRIYSKKVSEAADGVTVLAVLASVGCFVVFFFSGCFALTDHLADLAEKNGPAIKSSQVRMNPAWQSQMVDVRCPESEVSGKVEFLGKKTQTTFRLRAIRIRTDKKSTDLSADAGVLLYQRPSWRSRTPSVEIAGMRADGSWQSRYLDSEAVIARGQPLLMTVSLGAVKGANGWNGEPHDEKQSCRGLWVAF